MEINCKQELIKYYESHINKKGTHINLPDIVLSQLGDCNKFNPVDEFGINPRFNWVKRQNVIKGETMVDMAGSAGFFSLIAIDERIVSSSTVFDISEEALKVGELSSRLLGMDNKIKYENRSLEIEKLKELPDADVVICLNLIHHAGIEFDKEAVEEMGWENYVIEYLRQLRKKYNQMVISLAFKGVHKPKNLKIPFHRFEDFFSSTILKKAGWHCLTSANVGFLQTNQIMEKRGLAYKCKILGLDLIWAVTKKWGLTKRCAGYFNLSKPIKLGKYFIFIAE